MQFLVCALLLSGMLLSSAFIPPSPVSSVSLSHIGKARKSRIPEGDGEDMVIDSEGAYSWKEYVKRDEKRYKKNKKSRGEYKAAQGLDFTVFNGDRMFEEEDDWRKLYFEDTGEDDFAPEQYMNTKDTAECDI